LLLLLLPVSLSLELLLLIVLTLLLLLELELVLLFVVLLLLLLSCLMCIGAEHAVKSPVARLGSAHRDWARMYVSGRVSTRGSRWMTMTVMSNGRTIMAMARDDGQELVMKQDGGPSGLFLPCLALIVCLDAGPYLDTGQDD
jgi:hypothetical protein